METLVQRMFVYDSNKVCKLHNYTTPAKATCVCCPRERSDLDLMHSSAAQGSEAKRRKNQAAAEFSWDLYTMLNASLD